MFNKKILTTCVLAALGSVTVSTMGYAEEAAKEDVEVISVTGIRGALASAAEIKRESSTFVDSITASDAGSIPDLSVAEALSRIPGITVSRFTAGGTNGDFPSPEGSGNLIRGLGFIRSEFNGRDAFSADGGSALDWSAVPTQLVGRVDVFKNQQADLIEGGIGGTINLQTLAPLDNEDGIAKISIDSTYTDVREAFSPTVSGTFGKNFTTDNGQFGFLGSFTSSVLKSEINGYQTGALTPRDNIPASSFAEGQDISDPVGTIGLTPGFNLRTNEVDRDRESIYLAGQWKSADDNLEVLVKYVTVENETLSSEQTTEWFNSAATIKTGGVEVSDLVVRPFTSEGIPTCSGSEEENAGDCDVLIPVTGGAFQEGLITDDHRDWAGAYGLRTSNLGIGKKDYSKTDDISVNVKWRATDQLVVEFDAHRTTAESAKEEQWIGVNTFLNVFSRADIDNPYIEFSVDERTDIADGNRQPDGGNVTVPYVKPTNPADPSGSYLGFANDKFSEGEGNEHAFKIDAEYEFDNSDGWFQSVKMGARYAEREQVFKKADGNWKGVSPLWNGGIAPLNSLDKNIYEEVDFSGFFRGDVVGGENTTLLFPRSELVQNPALFYDYLQAEPDLQRSLWSPFAGDTALTVEVPDTDPETGLVKIDPETGNELTKRVLSTPTADLLRRSQNSDGSYNKEYTPGNTSNVTEETMSLFAMVKFAQDFDNGMSIEGNVGVRYVKNTLTSVGTRSFTPFGADEQEQTFTREVDGKDVDFPYPAEVELIDDKTDFLPETEAYLLTPTSARNVDVSEEHWLPSLNVKWNLNDDMLIRFGASQGISRPNTSDLSATQKIKANESTIRFENPRPGDPDFIDDDSIIIPPRGLVSANLLNIQIDGGNPDLIATTANSFDISYEWYFETGHFTFGVFKKDLKNIVESGTVPVDTITLDNTPVNINYNGKINLAEASVEGFETSYQDFFTGLPGIWANFGIQANYTYVDASSTPPPKFLDADQDGIADDDSADTTFRFGLSSLLQQSKHTGNLIGIYQDDALEVRLIYNYRSDFLNTYRDFVTGNPVFQKAESRVDASIRYDINDNLTTNFQVSNIFDEKGQSESQVDEAGTRYDRSSFLNERRLQLGLSYTF